VKPLLGHLAGESVFHRGNHDICSLLDKLPAAAYLCDAEGLITYFNQHAVEFWGRAPKLNATVDRFCGSFKLYATDGTPIPHDSCWMAKALLDAKEYNGCEIVIERPNGDRVTALAHANPFFDDRGRVTGAVNILVDITDRKIAESASARLAAIIESSDDAIVSKTLEGMIRSWNPGAERLFEYTAEEAVGQSITLIIPKERLEEERLILDRLSRGERIEHYETVRMSKSGKRIDISLTVSPIRDSTGRVVGASKIARDITAQKRAEAALREADRHKTEFLAILAHELRNPLVPLRNGLQILHRASHDAVAAERVRAMMERQLGHMIRLVDDLLDLSRISNGRIELRKERIDLLAAVQDALETCRPAIEAAGHQLAISLPPEPLWVEGDRTRLVQVFTNLLNNSTRYTPRGGRIRFAAERQGSDAVIAISDNGIGIPADIVPRIFDMFTQADRKSERSQGGLGVGLSLVRALVEQHGGTVRARSDGPGQGSEFAVRLPILLSAVGSGAPGRRILVVDDNVDGAVSLAMMLQILGHETRVVHDGQSAVDAATEFRPDVMLIDIGLPKLNGYQVCCRVREISWGARAVLIALTGWGQEEDRQRSKEAGFNLHLVKPVDPIALNQMLCSLLIAPA
jgi:two-component system, chemotaxis family, CheB/CheR fusion protein